LTPLFRDTESKSFSEEKQNSYWSKKRIVYGVSLALNISGFVFFWLEIAKNPISEDYWNIIEEKDGGSCRDNCRAGMATAAFFLMSLGKKIIYCRGSRQTQFIFCTSIFDFPKIKVNSNKAINLTQFIAR
jgi:hypothetical protein